VGGAVPQEGVPYAADLKPFLSPMGAPCIAPPFALVTAVDLNTQKVIWERRSGTAEDSGVAGIRTRLPIPMGVPGLGGSITTKGGLVFVAASGEQSLRAMDLKTGDVLWKGRLPAGGNATPMTYVSRDSGRQFVVIAAGGQPDADPAGRLPGGLRPAQGQALNRRPPSLVDGGRSWRTARVPGAGRVPAWALVSALPLPPTPKVSRGGRFAVCSRFHQPYSMPESLGRVGPWRAPRVRASAGGPGGGRGRDRKKSPLGAGLLAICDLSQLSTAAVVLGRFVHDAQQLVGIGQNEPGLGTRKRPERVVAK
jgi:hypothetical protein